MAGVETRTVEAAAKVVVVVRVGRGQSNQGDLAAVGARGEGVGAMAAVTAVAPPHDL